MEFKLHGVRGSIPVPSKEALKYGGNTTCIEISNASFQLIIDLFILITYIDFVFT